MNFTTNSNDFAAAMSATIAAVQKRNTIPILSHVLLRASDGVISVTASDLDMEVSAQFQAEGDDGAMTMEAATIFGALKKMPKDTTVTVATADGYATVKAGRSRLKIPTLDADQFPSMSESAWHTHFAIKSGDLARLLGRAAFCASTAEVQYFLNGVYLAGDGENVVAVATDTHRMAKVVSPLAQAFDGIIIGSKSVAHALRLLDGGDFVVNVAVSDAKIMFEFGETVIISKLIDGSFPDYQFVIDAVQSEKSMQALSEDFQRALGMVSVVTSEKGGRVKLNASGDTCALSMTGAGGQTASDEFSVSFDGEPHEVGFNVQYMGDVLRNVPGGVTLEFGDSNKPIKVLDDSDAGVLYLVSPMRGQ